MKRPCIYPESKLTALGASTSERTALPLKKEGRYYHMKPFNKYFEHELLRADATEEDAIKLFEEAKKYDFFSVCVDGCYLPLAWEHLRGSGIIIGTVIGYPLGTQTINTKAGELYEALQDGAEEVATTMNIGRLKDKKYNYLTSELTCLTATCGEKNVTFGVLLEPGLLTEEEIVEACRLAKSSGVDLVSTSSGFSDIGTTPEIIRLIRENVGPDIKVEASGGIETLEQAEALIEAGADKISTPNSAKIYEEWLKKNG